MKLARRALLTACQAKLEQKGEILRSSGHISFAPSLKQHLEALSRHPLGAHLAQGTCSGKVTAAIQMFPSIPQPDHSCICHWSGEAEHRSHPRPFSIQRHRDFGSRTQQGLLCQRSPQSNGVITK